MKDHDMEVIEKLLVKYKNSELQNTLYVAVCSEGTTVNKGNETDLTKRLFPASVILKHYISSWDISKTCCPDIVDLTICCGVLLMAKKPETWISNLLKNTKYLLVQDYCRIYRGGVTELGEDGDSMRYSYSPLFEAKFKNAYDLHAFDDKIIDIEKYESSSKSLVEGFEKLVSFVALLKGDIG